MKAQIIDILLWWIVSFQIIISISKLQYYANAKRAKTHARRTDFIEDIFYSLPGTLAEASVNFIRRPDLKVYLNTDIREARSIMKIALPVNENDLSSIENKLNLKENNPNSKKKLVFLIHGFLSDAGERWLSLLSDVYLKREDVIVYIVDWGTGAITVEYSLAVEKAHSVATELAAFIDVYINRFGRKASDIHIIGHGLGAQIAGLVGKKVPDIHRITGLDPTRYGFPENSPQLAKGDAKYVDVVHTSEQGVYDVMGDVDFFVNGGMYQNGCDSPISLGSVIDSFQANICAYRRVVMYFIESIDDQDCLFVAEEDIQLAAMDSAISFDPKRHTVLGLDTFKYKTRGKLYIFTARHPPFCLGAV